MKKNIWFLALPVYLLIFWTLLASCNTSTSSSSSTETWSLVTSLNQLHGKWKGSYKQTMPLKDVVELLEEAAESPMMSIPGVIPDDMKVTVSAEITTTINASEKTLAAEVKMTMTFSGKDIGIAWLIIKPLLQDNIPDAVFNDKSHSITMTESISDQPITDEEVDELLASGLEINQSGNKIKIPTGTILEEFSGDIPPGLIPAEIIMTRQ